MRRAARTLAGAWSRLAGLSALAAAASLLGACNQGWDPYSQVAPLCGQPVPKLGEIILDKDERTRTYLTPECKAALESVIPYDEASWANAPAGLKDRVTEAFQAILAYPLALPEKNEYFGLTPAIAGAIPGFFIDIYRERDNPNQSLFDYILTQSDVFEYGGDPGDTQDARYSPAISTKPRKTIIYSLYWDTSDPLDYFRTPFVRAATLAHEARHGDGILHTACDNKTGNSGFACDNELAGAYGFGATYLKYLLHGSGTCQGEGCLPPLGLFPIMQIGWEMCRAIHGHINHPFAELEALVGGNTCDYQVTAAWTLEHEGLPVPEAWKPTSGSDSGSMARSSMHPSDFHGPGKDLTCSAN